MATPRGAEHRDVEQRLRNLEQRCADLANSVLRQRQLQVSEGDFTVSGGGSVVVHDGGKVLVDAGGSVVAHTYPSGEHAAVLGDIYPEGDPTGYLGAGLLIQTSDGTDVVAIRTNAANAAGYALFGTLPKPVEQFQVIASQLAMLGTGVVSIDSNGNQLQLGLNASSTFIGHTTTSSAANARLETTGLLTRSTSSRRYKQDIETAVVDPDAVLSVEPRTWRDRAQVAEDPDTTQRYVGFIAEELDEVGLGQFVEYDDQGRPDAIQYDRLAVGLLVVAKRQARQLEDLAARLDALEAA